MPRDLLAGALLVTLLLVPAYGQEWTRFRGPNGTGVSDTKTIPVIWVETSFNWRVKLPGEGHSQPVLWGDRIFVTSAERQGKTRLVLCLNTRDGKTIWTKNFAHATHSRHKFNSFASTSPTVDEKRLYVVFGNPDKTVVRAFDHSGRPVWERNLGRYAGRHGYGGSPIIFENTLIVQNEHPGAAPKILALNCENGETAWESDRRQGRGAYCTPCVYKPDGASPELIFTSHAHGLSSLDARTGKLNWEAPLFDKRSVASPVVYKDLVFGTCGSGGGGNYLVAVRVGGKGDVSESHLAYKLTQAIPYVPTILVYDDRLFLWNDRGIASCVKPETGEVLWQERVPRPEGDRFFGSPVCVDGKIYCVSDSGEVVVIRASDEFEVLAQNQLGDECRGTPVVAGGRMYIRTAHQLVSVGGKPQP